MKSGEEHFKDYLEYLEKDNRQGLGLSLMASAFAGYAQGQGTLGRYHLLGDRFPRDLPAALKWLEKAVEQDYAPAMTALAAMYMFGDGVKVNGRKAVELLTKAIDLGDAEALYVRGVCSEKGIGVQKSAEDAKIWYAKAAEQGVTDSALMA